MQNLAKQNELYFSISELCITPKEIPQDVANKLLLYHIWPMQEIRKELGFPIWASQSSGFRPEWYELARGRSGNSQHCFDGKGAIDWTGADMERLLVAIVDLSPYTRICYYQNNRFIHCDYKRDDGRWFYTAKSPTSKWELKYKI